MNAKKFTSNEYCDGNHTDFANILVYKIINKMNFKNLIYWIFVIFLIYLAIEIFRKIIGGSLGFQEIVIGLLIANLGYSFSINSKLSEHIGWHKGRGDFN